MKAPLKSRSYALVVALAALLASTGLAQVTNLTNTAAAPIEADKVSPHQHGPMIFHGVGRDNATVTSENWSGYAVTGTSFTQALGSWVVSAVNCAATPNTYSAFWVGLDGYTSTTVEQTGTISACDGNTPLYYAWYESTLRPPFPSGPHHLTRDVISAEIHYKDLLFTITITDLTTRKSAIRIATSPGAQRSSAEWIAEAPYSGGILPLSDFGTVSFGPHPPGQPGTGTIWTNYATEGAGNPIPIGAFGSSVEMINMVSGSNAPEANPSVLSTDGTSFTVAWVSQ